MKEKKRARYRVTTEYLFRYLYDFEYAFMCSTCVFVYAFGREDAHCYCFGSVFVFSSVVKDLFY